MFVWTIQNVFWKSKLYISNKIILRKNICLTNVYQIYIQLISLFRQTDSSIIESKETETVKITISVRWKETKNENLGDGFSFYALWLKNDNLQLLLFRSLWNIQFILFFTFNWDFGHLNSFHRTIIVRFLVSGITNNL